MDIGTYTKTQKSGTSSNQITLNVAARTQYVSSNFNAYVDVGASWTRGSLDGSETVTVTVRNAANGASLATRTYTLLGNNPYNNSLTYTAPSSNLIYIEVVLSWNASTTITIKTGNANIAAPSITGISFSNIGATTATMTATANYNCNKWEYKVGSGAWTVYGLTDGTSAIASLSALTAGTANTVQVRATRTDIGRTGSATSASVTTLGKATINSISRVQLDVDAPSVDIDCTIYDTSYTYELTVYYDETVFILDMPLTFTSKGRQTKTIDLTASKSDILGEMPAVASLMITYTLNTTIGSSIYQDTADGEVYVTEENSAPVWAATPSITAFDEATQEFFGSSDIHNGVINNVTEYRGYCAGGAITRNGAIAIDHYYIVVGGNTITANVAQITSEAVGFAGNTTAIAFGAVDSRGFKVEYSVTDIPIWKYTPMYWQQTDVARRNGYDAEIDFTIRAKYDPLVATVGGTTYSNVPSTSITLRYSTDNGTTWSSTTLTGTNNTTDDTIDYTGTPLNITNTANVLIELTASDLLSTAPLTMTVPNGVPLIHYEKGLVVINGNLVLNGLLAFRINGDITNGTLSGATSIGYGETVTVRLLPNGGCVLPLGIDVVGASYTYDSSTGNITLSNVTGAVTITATCAETAYPLKSQIIAMDMDGNGTDENYLVLNISDSVAEVMARTTSISSAYNSGAGQTYYGSTMYTALEVTYYNTLSDTAKAAIVPKVFRQDSWYMNANGNPDYLGVNSSSTEFYVSLGSATFGTQETYHVYAISVQDIIDYLEVTPSMTAANTTLTYTNVQSLFNSTSNTIWLSSARSGTSNGATAVQCSTGVIGLSGTTTGGRSVYPAFKIDLSKISWSIVS